MKKMNFCLTAVAVMSLLFGCKKSQSDLVSSTNNGPRPPAAFVKGNQLKGTLKGTLKQDSIYYLVGNVVVNPKDTFAVMQGATIIAKGNYNIEVYGTLLCLG